MAKLTLTRAFAHYGARPINPRWTCSEIADDHSLVFCGWDHLLHNKGGRLYYDDRLSRWWANSHGRARLNDHLLTITPRTPIRLIIAEAKNQPAVDAGQGSRIQKRFVLRNDVTGKLTSFDGDRFVFDFVQV